MGCKERKYKEREKISRGEIEGWDQCSDTGEGWWSFSDPHHSISPEII